MLILPRRTKPSRAEAGSLDDRHEFFRHVDGAHHLEKVPPGICARLIGQDYVTRHFTANGIRLLAFKPKLSGK